MNKSMRQRFPGHFRLSPEELDLLWNECIFVLDTNVLLHLYRYSPTTVRTLKSVCKKLSDRLWIPEQVADEFFENRASVISDQIKSYEDGIKQIADLKRTFESQRSHPFLSNRLGKNITKVLDEAEEELKNGSSSQTDLLKSDPILNDFQDLFSHCIASESTEEATGKYLKIAKNRIESKKAPGYCDVKKKGEDEAHGDAIVWLQIMEMSKAKKLPVIFVTDDTKEDWWLIVKGKTQGPRPDLVKEFVRTTGQEFHMYTPAPFLEYASSKFSLTQSSKAVDEARRVTASRRKMRKKLLRHDSKNSNFSDEATYLVSLIEHIDMHLENFREFIFIVRSMPKSFWDTLEHPMSMPQDTYQEMCRVIDDCRCIVFLLRDLQAITNPGWHIALDEVEGQYSRSLMRLVVEIRRLPESIYDLVSTMLDDDKKKERHED